MLQLHLKRGDRSDMSEQGFAFILGGKKESFFSKSDCSFDTDWMDAVMPARSMAIFQQII
jgi:hypothetical protein